MMYFDPLLGKGEAVHEFMKLGGVVATNKSTLLSGYGVEYWLLST